MNRELVEQTTHPDALHRFVERMGQEWLIHTNEVEGTNIADKLTARLGVTKRDVSFLEKEVRFAADEERIRTRLGEEAIEVELTEPQSSPFGTGAPIAGIAIPRHMLPKTVPDEPVKPRPREGGFDFNVGDRSFRYDRLGVLRIES